MSLGVVHELGHFDNPGFTPEAHPQGIIQENWVHAERGEPLRCLSD
jgi:hypothetical protein